MPPSRRETDSIARDLSGEYQVIGNYAIGETIGKGSFGKVKKGRHIPTREAVAIKILNRKKLKNASMDKKIFREIEILRLFSHPNICRLYEVISTPTDIYLILEYVEGGELYDYIVKKGMLKEDAGRYVLQQIVCALEYCHHFLVVHRDLKPENILIGHGLQVKLIDFGLSNIMKDGEFLATSCGSPNYAAPEVISGKLYYGPEVDVWSCGVILFALMCGSLPFDEDTIPALFAKIKKGRYHIPSHVPQGARELIEQILVVDPLSRLTIPQIRDNVWFNTNLPMRLSYNETIFSRQERRISPTIASRVAKILSMRDREVRDEIKNGKGSGFVAYSILMDAERRKQIIAEAESLAVEDDDIPRNTNRITPRVCKATERELNLGLLLTQSPAMEVLLDHGDASSNKRAYNGGNFIPASVQETKSFAMAASMHTPMSVGNFSITKRPESQAEISNPFGGASMRESLSSLHPPSIYETNNNNNNNNNTTRLGSCGTLGASLSERQRVGSVAKSHMIYTQEEEQFIVKHNVGWRIGLMSDFSAVNSLSVIYSVLKSFEMEWKVRAPFRLLVRTTPETWAKIGLPVVNKSTENNNNNNNNNNNCTSSNMDTNESLSSTNATSPVVSLSSNENVPKVILVLYLFRIHEKHDKGYLVDFSVVSGSLLALDVVMRLSMALVQRMG